MKHSERTPRRRRRLCRILLLLLLPLLSGCRTTRAEELYALPRRSDIYLELQEAIEQAMGGASYEAPRSGTNLRAIQQADLDGDGRDEVLVFARAESEKPLKIHVLQQNGNEYRHLLSIDGDGAAFDAVQYVQLDGAPGMELVVSRNLTEQVTQSINVYAVRDGHAVELLSTGCNNYTLTDLDGDGLTDVFLIRADTTRPNGIAECYRWQENELRRDVEADLSAGAESVKRIITGKLTESLSAVFVASTYDDNNIITDIYAVVDGSFRNVSQSGDSGLSTGTVRSYNVYSADLDGDGIVELPQTVALQPIPDDPASEGQTRVDWYNFAPDGTRVQNCTTYHNYAGGWYLRLPERWLSRLAVTGAENADGSIGVSLYQLNGQKAPALLLTVYSLPAQTAEEQAEAGSMVLLQRRGDSCFCAVPGEALDIEVDTLIADFCLITTDATTGE